MTKVVEIRNVVSDKPGVLRLVSRLLERSDPVKLIFGDDGNAQDTTRDAEMMVSHLMSSRQKQKLMCQQLSMLDSMMEFLSGLESPHQVLNDKCAKASEGDARKQWKALKREYQAELAEVEDLIGHLQEQSDQLQQRTDRLNKQVKLFEQKKEQCQAVERLRMKRNKTAEMQMSLRLDESLQSSYRALQVADRQLRQLQQESHNLHLHLDDYLGIRDRLLSSLQVCQGQVQFQVTRRVSASKMCVELRPQSPQLKPLTLNITPKPPQHFLLQVVQDSAGMQEETLTGSTEELSAALRLVMQNYISQGAMLHELQELHSRFAIDWRPDQRLLLFLKTASVVCHLVVEEGYPSQGVATLQAVRKDGHELDIATLQPPSPQPNLTDWLEFLSCCPDL